MTRPPGGWRGLESGVAMSTRGADPVEEPFDYRARLIGDALRRHSLIIVACVVLGTLLGYGASVARPGSYVATATVLLNPLAGNPYSPGVSGQDSLVSIETESKVAVSDTVSSAAAASLGKVPVPELEKGVSVSVPPNTQIIEISFASSSASFAKAAAQAYVDSFMFHRRELAKTVSASQLKSLQNQLTSVQDHLKAAQTDSDAQQVKTLSSVKASLQQQIDTLTKTQTPEGGHVISPATTPGRVSGIGRPLYLVGGALFGLVAGLMLALARQRRDDRVLHVDEIDGAGIPVIAAWGGSRGQSAEATRLIRSRALAIPKRPTVIVVGPTRALGEPSPVAAALAASLAHLPRTVVLADLADDSVANPDGTARYGFTDLLTGRRSLLRELLVEKEANLTILPRGRADLGDASEFLDATRMRKVIAELPNRADYVVLNVPSLTDSLGETMMEIANLTVVTVTLARSTRSELALVKSRGDHRVGACLVPHVRRRRRIASSLRFRRGGSTHVARASDALTLVDDKEESA